MVFKNNKDRNIGDESLLFKCCKVDRIKFYKFLTVIVTNTIINLESRVIVWKIKIEKNKKELRK